MEHHIYESAKTGRLRLKGEKRVKKHKSHKRKHEESSSTNECDLDMVKHGGWWKATSTVEVRGEICLQYGENANFIKALDQGNFTLGAIHDEGDAPSPDEIFTVVPAGEGKIALKSGYGKYLGIIKKGLVVGMADAIGPKEKWEAIFQDGKSAILAANDMFVTVNDDEDIIANSKTATDNEIITIRTNSERLQDQTASLPDEEKGRIKDVELNYIKKFQKFQDKRIKMMAEGREDLIKSKKEGKLHEALLDRRSKMKADRYCK